ncbi:MAG: DUF547 domain-containing protein [Chloroflexi bacterium]|nr:DUF547 domain-containing protein [Chloroflexota bacterium]
MRLIHRLLLLRYGIPADFVLNSGAEPDGVAASGPAAAEIRRIANTLKAEAFDAERGRVDYSRLCASPTYFDYCKCARRLQSFDPTVLGDCEERLAFWINLYNALIVDAVIQFGVKRSVNEVPGFFWRAAYNIGGQRYCPFDIEYGILCANAPHPAIPGPHFGTSDPRRRYSLEQLDSRIHFALVCGARSCPPIAVYDAANIDEQLDVAARTFINSGGVEIDRVANEVWLSQIFQWYAPDFGGRSFAFGDKRPLLEFAASYLADEADHEFVLREKPAVRFKLYDWSLNN